MFQRTPSTVDVRENRPTDPEWAASLEPGWHTRRRENFQAVVTGHVAAEDLVADAWTASGHVLGKIISTDAHDDVDPGEWEEIEEYLDLEKMTAIRARVDHVVDDPATAELLKPWYRYACKRPTFSDEYLQAFNRPNVTLVDTADHGGVERMTERAVVGGVEYPVDCIIFATGFEVGMSDVLTGRLPVYGRDGTNLLQSWAVRRRAGRGGPPSRREAHRTDRRGRERVGRDAPPHVPGPRTVRRRMHARLLQQRGSFPRPTADLRPRPGPLPAAAA